MRLAFASPLPPAASGIADYSAEQLALLAGRHQLELFHAQASVEAARLPGSCALHPASRLVERHRERPFDLALYQMGNGPAHDFLYPLLPRLPGLLVLHDLVLHHARAAQFLESEEVRAWRASPGSVPARERARGTLEAWRAELEYSYPRRGARLFAAQLNTTGELLPYAYPLFRIPVEASRMVAVHNRYMRDAILEELPQARVAVAPMPMSRVAVDPRGVSQLRARLGFSEEHVVVGVFGLLTKEKRALAVAAAVAGLAAAFPRLRLLLVGPVPDPERLEAGLVGLGVRDRTALAGRVPLGELPAHIEAADVVAHLRYPTARETSAALLRVLAQGRPAIVSDLAHQADLPAGAVIRVDVADEPASLAAAMRRLVEDTDLRHAVGNAAADHVRREHDPARVARAWDEVFEQARAAPDPQPRDWPAHWPRLTGWSSA